MRNWMLLGLFCLIASIRPPTARASVRSFPVNIVNLASDPTRTVDLKRANRFISILNANFVERSGERIFDFALREFHRTEDLDVDICERLLALGEQTSKPSKDHVCAAFDACHDDRIADHHAINVYLFRSTWDGGEGRKSSRIYFHDFKPFIFMNVDRLDNDWNVWTHEFGHAFGLPEGLACGSKPETPTNPMGHESDLCEGTGGNRQLGFEPWQVAIMKATSAIVASRID